MRRTNQMLVYLILLIAAATSGVIFPVAHAKLVKLPVITTVTMDSNKSISGKVQYFNFVIPDSAANMGESCSDCVPGIHQYTRQRNTKDTGWLGWVSSTSSGSGLSGTYSGSIKGYFAWEVDRSKSVDGETIPLGYYNGDGKSQVCFSFYYKNSSVLALTGYKNFSTAGASASGGCTVTQPMSASCAFKTAALTFDYGIIDKSGAAGATSRQGAAVSCSGDVPIVLSFADRGQAIALSNGMTAQLTVNGEKIGDNNEMDLSSGEHELEIVSTLVGTPENTGAFNGSSVLEINYF